MNFIHVKYIAASNYNCGAYGAGNFNENTCSTQQTGNSSSAGSGGALADTGYDIIIPVAIGGALVLASAILLVKKLLRRKSQPK